MVLNQRFQGSRLVKSYDRRQPREKAPSFCLENEVAGSQFGAPAPEAEVVRMPIVVERVSVYSEEVGEHGKTVYSVVLELDPELNPSSRTRRTETVRGLALTVEEKELVGLARLSGRKLQLLIERGSDILDFESLELELQKREAEILRLEQRTKSLSEQLQFAMEQITRDSR